MEVSGPASNRIVEYYVGGCESKDGFDRLMHLMKSCCLTFCFSVLSSSGPPARSEMKWREVRVK